MMNFSKADRVLAFFLTVLPLLIIFLRPAVVPAEESANILLLNSYHPGYRWSDEIVRGIREAQGNKQTKVNLFVEYMDSKRIYNRELFKRLADLIEEKYSGVSLQAVIIADNNAFTFFKEYRQRLFKGIPGIFCGANDLRKSDLAGIEKITGVNEAADVKETLETAFNIFPGTNRVVVVSDQTTTGLNVMREIRRQSADFAERISFEYWDDLSMKSLIAKLAKLEEGTIVLYAFFFRDCENNFFEYDSSARLIASASSVPVFTLWEFNFGFGVVGGKLVSGYEQGRVAGNMALRVIAGDSIDSIPLVMKSPNRFAFDYSVLKKFKAEAVKLPEGSLVINKQITLYEQYKEIIWGSCLAFILLLTLTFFLLISIARQRRIEVNLRRSRNFITGITDNAPGVVFQLQITDKKRYELTFAGEKMSHIFGIDHSYPNLFDSFAASIQDDDRTYFWHSLSNAVEQRIPWDFEGRYFRPDGRMIWFAVQAAPRVEEGRTVFDGVLLDVTESKNTEYKLQQSEKRLSEIVNFLPDPTFVIDPDGRVIIWNKAIEDLTGIPAGDMLGKGNYEYALPFYGERRPVMIDLVSSWNDEIAEMYRDVSRVGDQLFSETIHPNTLLGGRYFRNVAGPLYDQNGNIAGAIESLHDITSRRKAEMEAEKLFNETQVNLSFIRALMAAIPIPLYFKDTSFRFTDCNQAYLDMQGFDDIRGKTVYDLYPKERADFYQKTDVDLLKDQKLQRFETEVIDRNGKLREVLFAKSVFEDHMGKVTGIVGTFMDISDLKDAERERENLEAQLRQSQKMEALGTLAGGIAHDFNNILSGVLGYSELGLREAGNDEKRILAKFREIHKAGMRAKELVDQILAFSRMQEQIKAPFTLNPLVKEVVKLLQSSLPANITIKTDLKSEKTVLGDASQIHQVIMNLCTNAYHAMLEEGGILTVGVADIEVDDAGISGGADLHAGWYVHLTVSDTGTGISPSDLDKVFDPYFTTKKKGKGTGLGLAVVHGIVKRHGGKILVESRLRQGSQFEVYFPACDMDIDEESIKESDLLHGHEHLLLVDDDQELIRIGTEMLIHLGYQVTSVEGSEKAMALFAKNPQDFDLVISDFDMPAMTGGELARKMLEVRPDIPIIICSGYAERLGDDEAQEIGIGKVITKPLSLIVLGREIRALLDR